MRAVTLTAIACLCSGAWRTWHLGASQLCLEVSSTATTSCPRPTDARLVNGWLPT